MKRDYIGRNWVVFRAVFKTLDKVEGRDKDETLYAQALDRD
jgi:hypothetical protein